MCSYFVALRRMCTMQSFERIVPIKIGISELSALQLWKVITTILICLCFLQLSLVYQAKVFMSQFSTYISAVISIVSYNAKCFVI